MRIIDKNTDFYDYYQNLYQDSTFTFDRRDSYLLTKDIICNSLKVDGYYSWKEKKFKFYRKTNYILLQICNTFWLFEIEVTKTDSHFHDEPTEFVADLIAHWRDFTKPRKLIDLNRIRFNKYLGFGKELTPEIMVNCIMVNDYEIKRSLNNYTIYNGNEKIEKHIPLLKASGLAHLLNAHEVFLAFEEYFSLEKSASEKQEPLGATNNDKIESHGFDLKTSFRGKN